MKKDYYIIVSDSNQSGFSFKVNLKINEGYVPLGEVSMTSELGNLQFAQALILKEEK